MKIQTDFEQFFKDYPQLSYDAGERIKRPMEHASNILYVKSGIIKVYTYAESGKEVTLLYMSPDHYKNVIFGFSSNLNSYYIEALTDTKVWKAPKVDFLEFVKSHPDVSLTLTDGLYALTSYLLKQLEHIKVGDAYNRVSSFIITLAHYFSEKKNNQCKVNFKLTHQMIADYTGLTRETVSLRIKKLKDNNIIEYNDAFLIILNKEKLEKELKTFK